MHPIHSLSSIPVFLPSPLWLETSSAVLQENPPVAGAWTGHDSLYTAGGSAPGGINRKEFFFSWLHVNYSSATFNLFYLYCNIKQYKTIMYRLPWWPFKRFFSKISAGLTNLLTLSREELNLKRFAFLSRGLMVNYTLSSTDSKHERRDLVVNNIITIKNRH